jgi:S-formylglutathione hydrolase
MNGTWTSVAISGKRAAVYQPEAGSRPRFGLLYLHDRDGKPLQERPVYTALFDELNLICLCPLAGPSWWTNRIWTEFDATLSPERHVLERVLPFLKERWNLAPPAIGLLGIGMGGQGALRLAFKYPDRFPVVAAVGAALDCHELYDRDPVLSALYDSKEQCRQDTALLHVHPSAYPAHIFFAADPGEALWFRGNDRLDEKLSALGIPHRVDFTTPPGGGGDYPNQLADRAARFLQAGLEQQSRRLL